MNLVITAGICFFVDAIIAVYYRENYIRSVVLLSCIYLVSLTLLQEMDIAFTIYLFFVFAALMYEARKVTTAVILYVLYLLPYVFCGLFFQEFMNTASVLCTRYGFLVLGLVQCGLRMPRYFDISEDIPFVLKWGTATEVVLAVYLFYNGDLENRLTINSQPVGGSLSIGLIVLSLAFYFIDRDLWRLQHMWKYLAVNLIIIILSGTRGYIVMAFLPLIPFLWDFFMDKRYYRFRWLCLAVFLWIFSIILFFRIDEIWNMIESIFRLNESIGYRVNENAFIKAVYVIEPWYNRLFGFGLGGRASHLPETLTIAWEMAEGKSWIVSRLLKETTCHNYWYMILFKQGIMGIFACLLVLFQFLKRIFSSRETDRHLFSVLLLFFAGILISMTFRISSTCGVFEILVLLWISELCQTWRICGSDYMNTY